MEVDIIELGHFVNKSVRQYAQGIKKEKSSWPKIFNRGITTLSVLDGIAGIVDGATKGAVANGIKRGFIKQGIRAGLKEGLSKGAGFICPAAGLGLTALGLISDYLDSVSSDNAMNVKDFNKIATFWDDVSRYDEEGFDCRIMLNESFSYTETKNGELKIKNVNLILKADIYNQENGKYEATIFTSLINSHYSL